MINREESYCFVAICSSMFKLRTKTLIASARFSRQNKNPMREARKSFSAGPGSCVEGHRLFLNLKSGDNALHAGRIPRDLDRLLDEPPMSLPLRSGKLLPPLDTTLTPVKSTFLSARSRSRTVFDSAWSWRSFRSRDFHGSFASDHSTTENKRQN